MTWNWKLFIFSFFLNVIVKLKLYSHTHRVPIIEQYTEQWKLSQCYDDIYVLFLLVFFPTNNWFLVNDTIWDAVTLYHFLLLFYQHRCESEVQPSCHWFERRRIPNERDKWEELNQHGGMEGAFKPIQAVRATCFSSLTSRR